MNSTINNSTDNHGARKLSPLRLAAVIVSALVLLWLLSAFVIPVLSQFFTHSSPDGAYRYKIFPEDNGTREIHVLVDMDDPGIFERYLHANEERALNLLEAESEERLWSAITFAEPLSVDDIEELVENTGVQAVSYTQVGFTATGERMGSTFYADLPDREFDLKEAVERRQVTDTEAPNYGANPTGFLLVEGYITASDASLGRLLNDERVYLVDTTAHEVQRLAALPDAVVVLPSPFWNMDWNVE